ncbi:hypothetical protein HY374_03790 [Candidatus Berkelbacteria bacterium]|nr:hypothetical protein [Candidatus Berkelbacteria bacterium]
MREPTESGPEYIGEQITSRRIAELCQELLANSPDEAYRLDGDDLRKFDSMAVEEAYVCGLGFLLAAGVENPEDVLKAHGIE